MKVKDAIKQARELSEPFRVTEGRKFKLSKVNPNDTSGLSSAKKATAKKALALGVETISKLQEMLYAEDRWAVLLIFQALDAAGKDGVIKHVMSGVNPQGCEVSSFKVPSAEEIDHDYLWRCMKRLPERGRIGIFNRSYYEETLVVRVHPEYLQRQKLPERLISTRIWRERFQDIRNFERYLSRNGVVVRKFFLHVSNEEQRKRFLARIENPEKNWKFSTADVRERDHWKEYMQAYEETICQTATVHAPWYVVPADNKWFTRLVVAAAVIDCLASLNLAYPKVQVEALKELEAAKMILES